jgi:transposase InsO family protein
MVMDIIRLAGPQRGVYYRLYVMIDIFSRCAVHFEVHATELGELAKDVMTEAIRLNGGIAPQAIHADRGDLDDIEASIGAAVVPQVRMRPAADGGPGRCRGRHRRLVSQSE